MTKKKLKDYFQWIETPVDSRLTLCEDQNKGKKDTLKCITIEGLPVDSYVIALDKNSKGAKVQRLFKESKLKGYNCRCDYLLVTDKELILIELKSNEPNSKGYVEKLKNKFNSEKSIFAYCDAVFVNFLKLHSFFDGKKIYFLKIYQPLTINKTTTTAFQKGAGTHTHPDRFGLLAVKNGDVIPYGMLLNALPYTLIS